MKQKYERRVLASSVRVQVLERGGRVLVLEKAKIGSYDAGLAGFILVLLSPLKWQIQFVFYNY